MPNRSSDEFYRDLAAAQPEWTRRQQEKVRAEIERQRVDELRLEELRGASAVQASREIERLKRRESAMARLSEVARMATGTLRRGRVPYDYMTNPNYLTRRKGLWAFNVTEKTARSVDTGGGDATLGPYLSFSTYFHLEGLDRIGRFYKFTGHLIGAQRGIPQKIYGEAPRAMEAAEIVGDEGQYYRIVYFAIINMVARATSQKQASV